jgi:hypothetical protein
MVRPPVARRPLRAAVALAAALLATACTGGSPEGQPEAGPATDPAASAQPTDQPGTATTGLTVGVPEGAPEELATSGLPLPAESVYLDRNADGAHLLLVTADVAPGEVRAFFLAEGELAGWRPAPGAGAPATLPGSRGALALEDETGGATAMVEIAEATAAERAAAAEVELDGPGWLVAITLAG